MKEYLPEGELYCRPDNKFYISHRKGLEESMSANRTLEAPCIVCDRAHNLIVDFGFIKGIIPRNEGAVGIEEGVTRDIALISRVNKPVCFKVQGLTRDSFGNESVILSRRAAQEECLRDYVKTLTPGDIIPVKVTHMEQFGAFVDMGCGLPSLIPIDLISVSRISHPADRFYIGQMIKTVVKSIDESSGFPKPGMTRKFTLSQKELLGTWEENVERYSVGETVAGVVRSIESYGIFVELTPNLAGLAELRESGTSHQPIYVGQQTSVYIKAIIPEKMKIKLIIVDTFDETDDRISGFLSRKNEYFIGGKHLDRWTYSCAGADKVIESVFNPRRNDI
ncbi:hypothetical protein FACS189499_08800 [Clostridia bacterium]|nr:hypothetical protein FACS189499_08800 [Clostridia bacterium]